MEQGILNLLIVDDEPNIVERLYSIFKSYPQLEVYKVYNGILAIDMMKKKKIDIALLDICMPKLSGMEVMREIKIMWPEARVLFLTGHKNFDYVYESIQHEYVKYILKSDGEEAIKKAIEEHIKSIYLERDQAALLDKASQQLKKLEPIILQESLLRIIRGEWDTNLLATDALPNIWIREKSFYLLLCELTGVAANSEEYLILKQLLGLLKEKIQGRSLGFFGPDHNQLYFLIDSENQQPSITLHAMIEQVQNLIYELYGCRISFAVSGEAIDLGGLRDTYLTLNRFVKMHFGMELLYSGGQEIEGRYSFHEITKLSNELKQNLYQGNEEKFLENCARLPHLFSGKNDSQNILLIWHHMCVVLLEIYNCYSVPLAQKDNRVISQLISNALLVQDVAELTKILEQCGRIIFRCQRQNWVNKTEQAIGQINHYIENHLDGDLSLGELASKVFLNPSYFSRLYKQATGYNLSDFINRKRMDRAKELLTNTNKKISEIAFQNGFDSSSYFTVFFKKFQGVSPIEYREQTQK